MRTALLAALKQTETGELRALLTMAGRSVLAWQVDLARQIGCERIICLCEAAQTEILELQRETEASGGEFHVVRGNLQLVALLRADDDLVMILDGLIVDQDEAQDALLRSGSLKKQVLNIVADSRQARNHPDDFERIDAQRHWAGLAAMPAVQAHKLADLPLDGDAQSLLLRLALQSGVPCEAIAMGSGDEAALVLATSTEALLSREKALIARSVEPVIWAGPGQAIAAQVTSRFAPRGLERGFALSVAAMAVCLVGALLCAWLGYATIGLVLIGIGAFSARLASAWAGLRAGLFHGPDRSGIARIFSLVVDVVALITLFVVLVPSPRQFEVLALPLFIIGLFRLAAIQSGPRMAAFWSDRVLQMLVFAAAAAVGILIPALIVSGLGALGSKLLRGHKI